MAVGCTVDLKRIIYTVKQIHSQIFQRVPSHADVFNCFFAGMNFHSGQRSTGGQQPDARKAEGCSTPLTAELTQNGSGAPRKLKNLFLERDSDLLLHGRGKFVLLNGSCCAWRGRTLTFRAVSVQKNDFPPRITITNRGGVTVPLSDCDKA